MVQWVTCGAKPTLASKHSFYLHFAFTPGYLIEKRGRVRMQSLHTSDSADLTFYASMVTAKEFLK